MQQFLRIFNIALWALVLTLILQMFLPKPQVQQQVTEHVSLSIKSDHVVIPNIPQITVHNSSSGAMMIHGCEDITFSRNQILLSGIATEAPDFCEPLTVAPSSSAHLSLNPLHEIFAKLPGKYILTLKTEYGDRQLSFEVSEPWFFRSFLSTVIYQPIYNLFVAILTFLPGHQLGWAIIIVTIIIRLILLIPQHKMLENSRKMNLINPKIQALRKEYKDDQAGLGVKMMELYKKEKINPAGSCLPLLIQMPILLGLYWVVSGIADPSNFYHLYAFFKDFDPTNIDTHFFGINLSNVGGTLGLVIALILGLAQWMQAYLSFQYNPVKKAKVEVKEDESPEVAMMDPMMMQKMMLYFFPLMLAVTSYFFPYGVSLYWFIGTLFVIGQQWFVNQKSKKEKKKGEIVRKED